MKYIFFASSSSYSLGTETFHTAADAGVSEVPQGLLRCLGGDIPREGAGIALSFCLCVLYLGYITNQSPITQGCTGGALAGWWWHLSRRRWDCSRVLTACIQATSLKGAQGMLWWVAMSLRARCFFFPTHVIVSERSRYKNWFLARWSLMYR